jgi:phosphate transport system substrate-binding protein
MNFQPLKSVNLFMAGMALLSVSLFSACNGGGSKSAADSSSTTTATTGGSSDDNTLLGAGSTFVYPLFSKLFDAYKTQTGVSVNYQSIGSGGGILQLTNKTIDFGDSDAPLNDDQAKKWVPRFCISRCVRARW